MTLEETVKQIFLDNQNKVLNKVLAGKFKDELHDECFKLEFKKIVGKLATVKEENGEKYLVLRSKYHRKTSANDAPAKVQKGPDGLQSSILQALTGNLSFDEINCSSAADFDKLDLFDALLNSPVSTPVNDNRVDPSDLSELPSQEDFKDVKFGLGDESSSQEDQLSNGVNENDDNVSKSDIDSNSQVSLCLPQPPNQSEETTAGQQTIMDTTAENVEKVSDNQELEIALCNQQDIASGHSDCSSPIRPSPVILPVPHFSNSEPDLQAYDGVKEDKIRITVNDHSDENAPPIVVEVPRSPVIPVVSVQKSGSEPNMTDVTVKARAKLYATGLNALNANRKSVQYQKNKARQSNKEDSMSPESGSVASITVSDEEREWLLTCVKCEYQTMVKILLAHPELMDYSDFTCGYTGLHWAAKNGHLDSIKLLAGKYKADVNCKTGYTPLHLAAMHGQRQAYSLLVETYSANQCLRDNSGRKAEDYVNNVYGTKRIKVADLAAHKSMSTTSTSSTNVRPRKMAPFYPSYPLSGLLGGSNGELGSDVSSVVEDSSYSNNNASWLSGVGSIFRGHNFRQTISDAFIANGNGGGGGGGGNTRNHSNAFAMFSVSSPLRNSIRSMPRMAWAGAKREIRRVVSSVTPPVSRPVVKKRNPPEYETLYEPTD